MGEVSAIKIEPLTQSHLPSIEAIQTHSQQAAHWPVNSYLLYESWVALRGETPLGFLVIRHVGDTESEVLNLAVSAGSRRQGIARSLLKHVLSQPYSDPDRIWYLEVRESNLPAIQLYSSLGFELAGRRANYYNSPTEAAIVMRKQS